MDKWVTITKPSSIGRAANINKDNNKAKNKYSPYNLKSSGKITSENSKNKDAVERILAPVIKDGNKPSSSAITKQLLKTLSDESNPITNSDIYERSDHVVSAATGHQRSEMRSSHRQEYFEYRTKKLAEQKTLKADNKVLYDVRVYINGFLQDTTDIELKRVISLAGGTTLNTPTGATHIITSQQLSGSKTHKLLKTKSRKSVHVVKPEWITDSISAGRRQREADYAVIKLASTRNIVDMFKADRFSPTPL